MKTVDFIFVGILFYVGWFGSVFLAKTEFSLASLFFPAILIGFLAFKKSLSRTDMLCALGISVFGILFDFLLIQFGFVTAQGKYVLLLPVWLVSIWLLFSFSMVKLALRFRPPLWLAAVLGFIMGPLSYKSGELFQVLTLSTSISLLIYAIFWAVMFPIILTLPKRFL